MWEGALTKLWCESGPPGALSFLPSLQTPNASVLVFFHNGAEGPLAMAVDGSFLAAVGNLIVVTASYRTGVFGFLSSGEWLAAVGTADACAGCVLCVRGALSSLQTPRPFPDPPPATQQAVERLAHSRTPRPCQRPRLSHGCPDYIYRVSEAVPSTLHVYLVMYLSGHVCIEALEAYTCAQLTWSGKSGAGIYHQSHRALGTLGLHQSSRGRKSHLLE